MLAIVEVAQHPGKFAGPPFVAGFRLFRGLGSAVSANRPHQCGPRDPDRCAVTAARQMLRLAPRHRPSCVSGHMHAVHMDNAQRCLTVVRSGNLNRPQGGVRPFAGKRLPSR